MKGVMGAGVIDNGCPVIRWAIGVIPHPCQSLPLIPVVLHSILSPCPCCLSVSSCLPLLSVPPSPHPCRSVLVIPHLALSLSHPSSPHHIALAVSILRTFSRKGSRAGVVVFTPSHPGLILWFIVPGPVVP